MSKPPLYLKVWVWLLLRAQHADFKDLKRGQVRTSIPEVQEAMSHYVGYRKTTPSYKQIRRIFDWLRCPDERACEGQNKGTLKGSMVGIVKGKHTITVTLHNYSVYQDPKNYEGHNEGHNEGHDGAPTKDARMDLDGQDMNKNVYKNDNNEQEKNIPYRDIVGYLNEKAGTSFKYTSRATREKIRARWMEGHRLDDFKRVIDNKVSSWKDTEYAKYLRPITLFSSSKFEGYLNEKAPTHQVKPFQPLPDLRKEVNHAPF